MPRSGRTSHLSRWRSTYDDVQIKSPSPVELAYLAGILDGEGYFQVSEKTNSFGLGVSMTDRCVIEWLGEHIGGRCQHDLVWTSSKRQVHRWVLQRHADLAFLLPRLRPYLVLKTRQAEAMIALVEHLRSYPAYDVPTSRSPKAERDRRRQVAAEWKEEGQRLRLAVRAARHPD